MIISDNCEFSSLILYQNLTRDHVSSAGSHVKYKTLLVNFKKFFYVSICWLFLDFEWHHFTTLSIGPMENSGSLGNADITNVNAFHCAI